MLYFNLLENILFLMEKNKQSMHFAQRLYGINAAF